MNIPGYHTIVHYATPPHSYIGTTIFLSYIIFALYATISILVSLYKQYTSIFNSSTKDARIQQTRTARLRHIKIYAFLSSISFATLSYHMLMFLITHYLSFYSFHRTPGLPVLSLSKLQRWMLESSLFRDFATSLVSTPANSLVTHSAILATWFWNLWIAQKAQRRNIFPSFMRTYILLSQILPISFTATLFIIQLHLNSPDIQEEVPEGDPTKSSTPLASGKRKARAGLQIPNILLNAALLAQPALEGHPVFSSLLFLERGLLLLPHSGLVSLKDSEVVKCITVAGGFLMANAVMMRKGLSWYRVAGALGGGEGDGGYAVKALGWDAVLGVVVAGVLGWGGGV